MPYRTFLMFLAILSLWDIYVEALGVRPLDLIGLGFLWLYGIRRLAHGSYFSDRHEHLLSYFLLLTWFGCFSVPALWHSTDNIKPIIGFFLGLNVFILFHSTPISSDVIARSTKLIMGIHASYFLLQLIYFYVTGNVLNIYAGIGLEPRALSIIFRPTGLYLEPASYSISMLLLLTLRTAATGKADRFFYFIITTIFISISMWGILASILILGIQHRRHLHWFLIATAALLLAGAAFSDNETLSPIINDFIFYRIENLGSDNSAQDRYGALFSSTNTEEMNWRLIFGSGISNDYGDVGSNSLFFLLNASGVVGLMFFLIILQPLAGKKHQWIKASTVIVLMTAAPMWNTFLWWVWLALYLKTQAPPMPQRTDPKRIAILNLT